jgi:hypothetical protein
MVPVTTLKSNARKEDFENAAMSDLEEIEKAEVNAKREINT